MASEHYNDWQWEQRDCQCPVHRYHVAHLCGDCAEVVSHSQSDWDAHRTCLMVDFNPKEYKHGWDFSKTFDHLLALGTLPFGTPEFDACYYASDRTLSEVLAAQIAADERKGDRNARLLAMQSRCNGDA